MKKKVFFRADGNSQMGLGHVVRSLSLVEMLKDFFECIFVIKNPSETVKSQIGEVADGLIEIPGEISNSDEVSYLIENHLTGHDIVVLDGYHFRTDYQLQLKNLGCKIVCIDDIHAYHFMADIVINHAGGIPESSYSREAYTTLALGPEYALLRPAFLKASHNKQKIRPIKHVFVCFGGSDPKNLMPKVANELLESSEIEKVKLVAGSANNHLPELLLWAERNERIEVYHDLSADEMVSLMRSCELAVAPASSISYEVCSLGLLLYCGKYVDNQDSLYEYLVAGNLAIGAGNFENEFPSVNPLPGLEEYQSKQFSQQQIFDGLSGKRLRKLFYKLALEIRDAGPDDVHQYFQWANDPETRLNSVNTGDIKWEDHVGWYTRKISQDNHRFYFLTINRQPIGQVRFDIENNTATIAYSIDKNFRGVGIGSCLLEKAIEQLHRDVPTGLGIRGIVKPANLSSATVLRNLGFQETSFEDFIQFSLNH